MALTQTQIIQGPVTPGGTTLTVANADLGAAVVKKANILMFASNGKTGTGSAQSIAHGLGVVPAFVTVVLTGSTASQAVTYGTHTSTNCVVTVTSGASYDIVAFG